MEWSAEGLLLGVRNLGETSTIIEVFTREYGVYYGVVRGGKSKKIAPTLQPGAQLDVTWRARLENHLGVFNAELLSSRFSMVLNQRDSLAGLNSICSLLRFSLPERDPHPVLYDRTIYLLNMLTNNSNWPFLYMKWELALLQDMGFGLDLDRCAVTNQTENLQYISPKSGRAVSKKAAGKWADKLLPLPACLTDIDKSSDANLEDGFKVTGYFLKNWLAPLMNDKPLPTSRERLLDTLRRKGEL